MCDHPKVFEVPENVIKNLLSGQSIISHKKYHHKMCGHAAGQTYDPKKNKLHTLLSCQSAFLAEASRNQNTLTVDAYNSLAQTLNWPSEHLKPMIP